MMDKHDKERLIQWGKLGGTPDRHARRSSSPNQSKRSPRTVRAEHRSDSDYWPALEDVEPDRSVGPSRPPGSPKRRRDAGTARPTAQHTGQARSRHDFTAVDRKEFHDNDVARFRDFMQSGRTTYLATGAVDKGGGRVPTQPAEPASARTRARSYSPPHRLEWLTPCDSPLRAGFPALLENSSQGAGPRGMRFVGIDAGTSAVRIAIYEDRADRRTLYDFGPNPAGGTRFSLPAVVAVDGDRLLLGGAAMGGAPSSRFVSFKAALLHASIDDEIRAGFLGALPSGMLQWPCEFPSPADFLFSVSIAHALEQALGDLVRPDGDESCAFHTTVGAPIDGMEGAESRFRRGLACGVSLAGRLPADLRLEPLLGLYAQAWERSSDLCASPAEAQPLSVRSEALSVVLGVNDVLREFGDNFLIADIGASTTDVSVIRVGDDCLACYAAISIPVGVDNIDRMMLRATGGQDLLEVRLTRQQLGWSGQWEETVASAVDGTATQLREALSAVLKAAIRKNDDGVGWEMFNVVVVGGGSNIPGLRNVFTRNLPHKQIRRCHVRAAHLASVQVAGASEAVPGNGEAFELLSVLGCSSPPWEGVEYLTPDRVDDVVPLFENPEEEERRRARNTRWV
jgi:hypothetical protein